MGRRTASLVTLLVAALATTAASCGGENDPGTSPDPDRDAGPADGSGLVLSADVAVMESFPVQLRGTLTVENPTDHPITFQVGGCPVFLRAYRGEDGGPVWDQAAATACILILRTVTLEPGDVEAFQTPTAGAGEILGDDLPDGRYRIAVYLALAPRGEREVPADEVDLAVPR